MTTTDVTQWVEKLDEMTANEIAALFRQEGVTGIPGQTSRCPIANFLKRKGQVMVISVGGGWVDWTETLTTGNTVDIRHGNFVSKHSRGGIREFVERFDFGEYPQLRAFHYSPHVMSDVLKASSYALAGV